MLSDEACFLHMLEGEYTSISENNTIKTAAKESLLILASFLFLRTQRNVKQL